MAQVRESQTRMVSGDIGLAFLHHVEMRIKGRGFEYFGKGQFHLVGERREMGGGNLAIGVLDQVQVLDQQIAPPRPIAKQRLDLLRGPGVDLTPLGGRFRSLASHARMFERTNLMHVMTHCRFPLSLDPAILNAGMPDAKKNMGLTGPVPAPRAAYRDPTPDKDEIGQKRRGRQRCCMPLGWSGGRTPRPQVLFMQSSM
jgi:hypothetical protein